MKKCWTLYFVWNILENNFFFSRVCPKKVQITFKGKCKKYNYIIIKNIYSRQAHWSLIHGVFSVKIDIFAQHNTWITYILRCTVILRAIRFIFQQGFKRSLTAVIRCVTKNNDICWKQSSTWLFCSGIALPWY